MIGIPHVLEAVYALCVGDTVYVGETTNLYNRIGDHLLLLDNNQHTCLELQEAYNQNPSRLSIFLLDASSDCHNKDGRLHIEAFWSERLQSVNRYLGKSGKTNTAGKIPCKWCDREYAPNNIKRHQKACHYNPANQND